MIKILKDTKFKKGFTISHTISNVYSKDMIVWKFEPGKPYWKICQWGSKFPFNENATILCNDHFRKITNPQKSVYRYKDGSVLLHIKTDLEYEHDRLDGEAWPHLLIEQFFTRVNVSKLRNLNVLIDFDFVKFTDLMGDRATKLHTFQVTWYFCIGCKNKASKGYNDFFWFGIPFIDTPRLSMGKPYEAADLGKEDCTSKYIISIDPHQYIKKPTEPGDNFHVEMDIKPYLEKAFNKAKSMGYLKDVSWNEMSLISTNFGIEDTGTFNGRIKINKIDIFSN